MLGLTGLHFSHRMVATECSDDEEEPPKGVVTTSGASSASTIVAASSSSRKQRGRPAGWTNKCGLGYNEFRATPPEDGEEPTNVATFGGSSTIVAASISSISSRGRPAGWTNKCGLKYNEFRAAKEGQSFDGRTSKKRRSMESSIAPDAASAPGAQGAAQAAQGAASGSFAGPCGEDSIPTLEAYVELLQEIRRLKDDNDRLDKRFREERQDKLDALENAGKWADRRVERVRSEAVKRITELQESIQHLHVARRKAQETAEIMSNRAQEEQVRADKGHQQIMCCVCMEEERNMVGFCGHLAVCETCSEKVRDCPICRCTRNLCEPERPFFRMAIRS